MPDATRDLPTITVLYLSASPRDQVALPLDEELRAVDAAIREAAHRDRVTLVSHGALRAGDLQALFQRHRPTVVHFSGHGTARDGIALVGDDGETTSVPADALAKVFAAHRDHIRCVVLDACWTQPQADAIAPHVDFVVGMTDKLDDASGRRFAIAFHQAVAYGRTVQQAFDQGCAEIDLHGLGEGDVPQLLVRPDAPAPSTFAFIPRTPRPSWWTRKRLAIAGVVAVAVLAAGGVGLLWPNGEPDRTPRASPQVAIVLHKNLRPHLGLDPTTSPYTIVLAGRTLRLTRRGFLLGGSTPSPALLDELAKVKHKLEFPLEPLDVPIAAGLTLEAEIRFNGVRCGAETLSVQEGAKAWPIEDCAPTTAPVP